MKLAELSTAARKALKDSDFAIPGKRMLPIHDEGHVRAAMGRLKGTRGITAEERSTAKQKIKRAAKKHGIEVSDDFSEYERQYEPLLIAGPKLAFDELADADVVRLPYVQVGEWNFRDSYGQVEVTDLDLDRIVENFDRAARRQDLPLMVSSPALNEEHVELPDGADPDSYVGPGAVGWIQRMERDGDTVWADVKLNPLGRKLIQDDRYRATSPELLRRWIDPETDEDWGMTAAGLALTTMPKMKGLATQGRPLATIAASERRTFGRARVLACAEWSADVHIDRPLPGFSVSYAFPDQRRLPLNTAEAVKGSVARFQTVDATEPERDKAWEALKRAAGEHGVDAPADWRDLKASECARLLMAEMDPDEEADEPALCIYQPPVAPLGCCPGYTRSPNDDDDGDVDVCVLWKVGDIRCNGYIPCGAGETVHMGGATLLMPESASYYREGIRGAQMDPSKTPTPTSTGAPAAQTATTGTAPKPEPTGQPADFAELHNLLAAERVEREALANRLEASERQNAELAASLRARDAAERLGRTTDRIDALVSSGRITPAQRDKMVAAETLAKFAENPDLLEAFEAAPANSAVPLAEVGRGTEETLPEDARIARFAENYRAEQAKQGNKVSVKDALLYAARELNRSGYRG